MMCDRYAVVRDRKITSDRYELITRDHPDYEAVLVILSTYPDLHGIHGYTRFLRIPLDGVKMIYPNTGRPYLDVTVWERDTNGDILIIDNEPVSEPHTRQIWID